MLEFRQIATEASEGKKEEGKEEREIKEGSEKGAEKQAQEESICARYGI